MTFEEVSAEGVARYTARLAPTLGGRGGYSIRVTPAHRLLSDPADSGLALWA
jgi:hypothetical protein